MSSDPDIADADASAGDDEGIIGEPTVLLFMRPGRDRELLAETLGERYRIETTTDVEALDVKFDCCIFDTQEFNRVAGTVQSRRDTSEPVFLPFVLLVGESAGGESEGAWDYVDDVIELPVKKTALHARIRNLIERRRTAARLAQRETELAETVADLRLKERAMDEAPVGITIAEAGGEDDPLVYANKRFEGITGFSSNMLGEDCRFLQGEETDPATIATIREAIDAREPVSVDILNYRKNGQKFWNNLNIAPIRDDEGAVTNFVGFQSEITDRKIRERRLEVLNRVLSHNLRNKMNVIEGYATLLGDRYDDAEQPEELAEIQRAAADLLGLAEAAQKIERTLEAAESTETTVDLTERMDQLISGFRDRYPDAQFELELPAGPCEVTAVGLLTATEEAIENAVKHNDSPEPSVDITVARPSGGWVEIEIVDNGPGIPSQELDVLREGETPLHHAERLGLWLMYWVVNRAGGEFSVSEVDGDRTAVTFAVPTHN